MSTPEPHIQEEPQTQVRQIAAYHSESRKTLGLLLLAVLILIGLLGLLVFMQLATRPDPIGFKLNSNMQIIDPLPLDQEGISKGALLNWVNDLLIDAFSYNYSNEDKQHDKLVEYMSETAIDAYLRLLDTDEDLASVKDMQYVVSVVPKAAPEILVSRSFRDRFAWQIRVPATVHFTNALIKQAQQVQVEFLILRVPETESPLGIKVAGFNYKVISRTNRENIRQGF